jgi:hypothetical protein
MLGAAASRKAWAAMALILDFDDKLAGTYLPRFGKRLPLTGIKNGVSLLVSK